MNQEISVPKLMRVAGWSALILGVMATSSHALVIDLVPGSTISSNSQALSAFQRAAQRWESQFSDPVTVTVDIDLGTFGNPNIIGSAGAVVLQGGYTEVTDAMIADAAGGSLNDEIATFLPNSAPPVNLPNGVSAVTDILLTKANAKALGFTDLDAFFGVSDGTITFNSAFAFDYDSSDGITPGTMDFETVAAHELGHTLGFLSSVDDVDQGATLIGLTTLDLFRFNSSDLPTTTTEFAAKARELRPGVPADFSTLSLSAAFSTGVSQGDGNQASHWKNDDITGIYIGIMDPTLAYGVVEAITPSDVLALDVIGYDIVPEPTSMGLMGIAGMMMLGRRRQKSVQQ